MIEFAWPYAFLLLPLPWILQIVFKRNDSNEVAALKVPYLQDFSCLESSTSFKRSSQWNFVFFIGTLAWLALVTASARPQWIGGPVEIPQTGRNLMVAVDLSGSMSTKDFAINGTAVDRLTALKSIVGDFISRRKGDRLGLILFGSHAYLQTPLTFDTATVQKFLNEAVLGLAGNETAIGDAIGLAVKYLRDTPEQSRVLILLTDGKINAGELNYDKAAELASNANLKVYTVAIGSNEMIMQTIFGAKRVNPSADIDEKSLQMIAEKTGGHYFRAYDTKNLASIYQHLDKLEPINNESKFYREVDEIYYYPLLVAMVLMAGLIIRKVRA